MDSHPNYNYTTPQKYGNQKGLVEKFIQSKSYQDLVNFLITIQCKCKGLKCSEVATTNPCLKNFDLLFDYLEKIYIRNPPKTGEERYDDPVFKRFHDDLTKNYLDIMNTTILKDAKIPNIEIELKTYFLTSFGNESRLDYGTGHELNFLCFLFVLYKSNLFSDNDLSYMALYVFKKYILFVRKLQTEYILEPAGTRGVWGLDEYQFIPFIFGAAQLIGHIEITPASIMDDNILELYKDDYLYLDCVKYIKSVKKGAGFTEYAPILASITQVKSWEKVSSGLVKMYQDDVMKKIVVIQHFNFGSVIKID